MLAELLKLDGAALVWIQEHLRCAALTLPMRLFSALGNGGALWIALAALLLIFPRTRRAGARCAAAMLLTFLLVNCALKPIIGRMRPYERIPELVILISPPGDASFPSGHSANGFACAWAMFRTLPRRWGWAALALAALIAFSRLYVGVHYPTDVLAGAALGALLAEAAVRLLRRWKGPEPKISA